jgi:hypothetical protein
VNAEPSAPFRVERWFVYAVLGVGVVMLLAFLVLLSVPILFLVSECASGLAHPID